MTTATKISGMAMTARNVPKVMSGEKTQTRRIESWLSRIDDIYDHVDKMFDEENGEVWFRFSVSDGDSTAYEDAKPRHQVGDRFYVKEALQVALPEGNHARYKTDNRIVMAGELPRKWQRDDGTPWKNSTIPARYMPKSAARTFIKITDVRCERIQDISVSDMVAEGIVGESQSFKGLWDETNGKGAWDRNDWTFAYTFELCEVV